MHSDEKVCFLDLTKVISNFRLHLCVFYTPSFRLTEIVPGTQDDDDSILTFHGLLHILYVKDISNHNPGCTVVSRKLGRVTHQHRHFIP